MKSSEEENKMSATKLLLLFLSFEGLAALQWTQEVQTRNTSNVCMGYIFIVGWAFDLDAGEILETIAWSYSPSTDVDEWWRAELSAVAYVDSNGTGAMAAYQNRTTFVNNYTVVLSAVTANDTGTYSVGVYSRFNDSVNTIRRNLVLIVADPDSYKSTALRLELVNMPMKRTPGDTIHTRLRCGPVIFRADPPIDVIWTTPSRVSLNSTRYQNGSFHLDFDGPTFETGVYWCRLPASVFPSMCLVSGDPLTGNVSLQTNRMGDLFRILETRLRLNRDYSEDLFEQTMEMNASNIFQTAYFSNVTTKLEMFREKTLSGVSFHAEKNWQESKSNGQRLTAFRNVIHNEGGAFDASTGIFTAPVAGTYFLAFTTSPYANEALTECKLYYNDRQYVKMYSKYFQYYNTASVQFLNHLAKNEQIYILATRGGVQFYSYSLFSGVLVFRDH